MALLLRGSYIVKRARGGTLVRGRPDFFLLAKMLVCPHHLLMIEVSLKYPNLRILIGF